jgi:hypothetical protein
MRKNKYEKNKVRAITPYVGVGFQGMRYGIQNQVCRRPLKEY